MEATGSIWDYIIGLYTSGDIGKRENKMETTI